MNESTRHGDLLYGISYLRKAVEYPLWDIHGERRVKEHHGLFSEGLSLEEQR